MDGGAKQAGIVLHWGTPVVLEWQRLGTVKGKRG